MKLSLFLLAGAASALKLTAVSKDTMEGCSEQPIVGGAGVDNDSQFATVDGASAEYRNAWNDCGGVGVSATMRTRQMQAKIKGFPAPLPFVRNAAQDAVFGADGESPAATLPEDYKPMMTRNVYPKPAVLKDARDGLRRAKEVTAAYA